MYITLDAIHTRRFSLKIRRTALLVIGGRVCEFSDQPSAGLRLESSTAGFLGSVTILPLTFDLTSTRFGS